MKKIIIIIALLLVSCTDKTTTTTVTPYYERMEKIPQPIQIEMFNGITRSKLVYVTHLIVFPENDLAVYYDEATEIYYIYTINSNVLDNNCTIATQEKLNKIFS